MPCETFPALAGEYRADGCWIGADEGEVEGSAEGEEERTREEEEGGGGAIGPDGARHWTETLFGAEQACNSKPKMSN